jgi:hypothetical protein
MAKKLEHTKPCGNDPISSKVQKAAHYTRATSWKFQPAAACRSLLWMLRVQF